MAVVGVRVRWMAAVVPSVRWMAVVGVRVRWMAAVVPSVRWMAVAGVSAPPNWSESH